MFRSDVTQQEKIAEPVLFSVTSRHSQAPKATKGSQPTSSAELRGKQRQLPEDNSDSHKTQRIQGVKRQTEGEEDSIAKKLVHRVRNMHRGKKHYHKQKDGNQSNSPWWTLSPLTGHKPGHFSHNHSTDMVSYLRVRPLGP